MEWRELTSNADLLGLAILTETPRGLTVWHLSYGLGADGALREPTLSGAWVSVDHDLLKKLTTGRLILDDEHAEQRLQALADEIRSTHADLTERYEAQALKHKHLVPPQWLPVPPLDVAATEAFGTPEDMRLPVARATWGQRLLSAWVNTETTRLGRKYLRESGGPRARLYPPDWQLV